MRWTRSLSLSLLQTPSQRSQLEGAVTASKAIPYASGLWSQQQHSQKTDPLTMKRQVSQRREDAVGATQGVG